jgi:hypothetical protein
LRACLSLPGVRHARAHLVLLVARACVLCSLSTVAHTATLCTHSSLALTTTTTTTPSHLPPAFAVLSCARAMADHVPHHSHRPTSPTRATVPAHRVAHTVHSSLASPPASGMLAAPLAGYDALTQLSTTPSTSPVRGIVPFARVVEHQSLELSPAAVSRAASSTADSAKSLAGLPALRTQPPHSQPQPFTPRREKDEKQISTPTPAPFTATPKAMLLPAPPADQPTHSHAPNSTLVDAAAEQHMPHVSAVQSLSSTGSAAAALLAQPPSPAQPRAQPSQLISAFFLPVPAHTQTPQQVHTMTRQVSASASASVTVTGQTAATIRLSSGAPSSTVAQAPPVPSRHLPSATHTHTVSNNSSQPQAMEGVELQHATTTSTPDPAMATTPPVPTSAFFSRLATLFSALAVSKRAGATSGVATPAAPSFSLTAGATSSASSLNLTLDLACHCLVVDSNKFAKESLTKDADMLVRALNLVDVDHRAELRDLLQQQWLTQLPPDAICVAYVDSRVRVKTLHINFTTIDHLSTALKTYPFLSRCGVGGSTWGAPSRCGLVKHLLPEMLQLRCHIGQRTDRDISNLHTDITSLLKEMKLDGASHWFPPSTNPAQQAEVRYVVINVLPRFADEATLSQVINRLHEKHTLWGSVVRICAPNTPSLDRCTLCNGLGHKAHSCPMYDGLAVRLLFTQPVPYQQLLKMQTGVGAHRAYLGSGLDEVRPHRKVTLLFDDSKSEDQLQDLYKRLEQLLVQVQPMLHQHPMAVNPIDRRRECPECGSLLRPHACPFMAQSHSVSAILQSNNAQQNQKVVPTATPAVRGSRSDAQQRAGSDRKEAGKEDSHICKSWRRLHACGRGDACSHPHPPDHVPDNICREFKERAFCQRGSTCKFVHLHRPDQPQAVVATPQPQAPVVAVPVASAAASPSSSSSTVQVAQTSTSSASADAPLSPSLVALATGTAESAVTITPVSVAQTSSGAAAGPSPAAVATSPNRKRVRPPSAVDSSKEAAATTPTASPSSSAKKSRKALFAAPQSLTHANRFAMHASEMECDVDDEKSVPAVRRHNSGSSVPPSVTDAPPSSLSSLSAFSSPQKLQPPSSKQRTDLNKPTRGRSSASADAPSAHRA